VTKKKKKGKKKQDKKDVNQPTMVVGNGNVEETSNMHHKPRYSYKICKGYHFLIDCLVFVRSCKYVNKIIINILLIHQPVIVRILGKMVKLGFLVDYAKGFIIVNFPSYR